MLYMKIIDLTETAREYYKKNSYRRHDNLQTRVRVICRLASRPLVNARTVEFVKAANAFRQRCSPTKRLVTAAAAGKGN